MAIVWRVLLGTASGLAMVAGTQAAELGDKAEPVQFVKICSLDGHSYYYIPGNDACTKNGLSLTIGADDRRSKSLMNLSGATAPRIGGQSIDHRGRGMVRPVHFAAHRSGLGLRRPGRGHARRPGLHGRQLRAEQSRPCRVQFVPAGGRGRLRSRQRQARLLHGARRRGEDADFRCRRSHRRRRSIQPGWPIRFRQRPWPVDPRSVRRRQQPGGRLAARRRLRHRIDHGVVGSGGL